MNSTLEPAPSGTVNPVQRFLDLAHFALLVGRLTPLQSHEIEAAVQAHEKANMVDTVALQDQRASIDKHWAEVNSTFEKHSFTCTMMRNLGYNFAMLLLEDYLEEHFSGESLVKNTYLGLCIQMFGTESQREAVVRVHGHGDESRFRNKYEKTIGYAIKEFRLDRDHMEHRFRVAAKEEKLTKMLLDARDEVQLLQIIQKDMSALQQIASFFPPLLEVQKMIGAQAQYLLLHMRPSKAAVSAQSQTSWLFTRLSNTLRSVSSEQPSISRESVLGLATLLSDADKQKKNL